MQNIETIIKGPIRVGVLRAVAKEGLPEKLSSYEYIQKIIIPKKGGETCEVFYIGRHEGRRGFVRMKKMFDSKVFCNSTFHGPRTDYSWYEDRYGGDVAYASSEGYPLE